MKLAKYIFMASLGMASLSYRETIRRNCFQNQFEL